ncbi:MAG: tetratricopeptide repeat protein [Elusimicrobiota bacterium]
MTASRSRLSLIVLIQFICPLIFFTDLTRNPYITQIALLDIGLCAAAALWAWEQFRAPSPSCPRTQLDAPWLAWLAVCMTTWAIAYIGHASFYRPSMRAEGARVLYFTVFNCCLPFFLAAICAQEPLESEGPSPNGWAVFCVLWGALWLFFPQLRSPSAGSGIWTHVWDVYGALLWLIAAAATLTLARRGSVHDVLHAAMAAGFIGAAYGVIQYFNIEFIWAKALNPYGGRSVSSFGNPNFMSSYLVLLLPLSAAYYLRARSRGQRMVYGAVFLTYEAALLCSLTRSSWVGAAAALAILGLSPEARRAIKKDPQMSGLVLTAGALIALLWPQSLIGGYTSSAFGRLSEVGLIFKPVEPGGVPYSPFYQRMLIWACAWQMGAESPLFGKGWGLFELFYPFYQGGLLEQLDFMRIMRTHANNAHNEMLEIWAQTGLLGLGVFFWTWTAFFRSAVHRCLPDGLSGAAKNNRAPDSTLWLHALCAAVGGMLIDNLINVSLHFAVPAFLFWWLAGTMMGRLAQEQQRRWVLPSIPALRRGALAAGLLFLGWGAWQGVRLWAREAHYFAGFKLARTGQLAQAASELELAYRWHPHEVNNNYELGNAYARADRLPQALWAYQAALDANAGYDEIYFNKGSLLANRMGNREEALRNYLLSWAINPLSQDLYANLAGLLLQDPRKNRDLAIRVLERAAHFFPDNIHFRNNLGYLYSLGGESGKAEAEYAGLLRYRPDFSTAESNLRASLRQSGHPAPEILRKLDGLRRLENLVRARDLGPATLSLARETALYFPQDIRARFYAGNLELFSGQSAAAEVHLRAVLSIDPRNVPARVNLAQALVRMGRPAEGAELLREALALDPKNASIASALQQLTSAPR